MKKYSSKVAVLLVVLICAIGLSYSKYGHIQKPATQEKRVNLEKSSPVANAQSAREGATDKLLVDIVPPGNIDTCEELVEPKLVASCNQMCAPDGTYVQEMIASREKKTPEEMQTYMAACPNKVKDDLIDPCLKKEGSDLDHYQCLQTNFMAKGIDLANAKIGPVDEKDVPNITTALREAKKDHKHIIAKVDETNQIVRHTKPMIENTNRKVNKIYNKVSGNPSVSGNQIDATSKVGSVPPNGKKKKHGQGGNSGSGNSLDADLRAMYAKDNWKGICAVIGRALELDPNNTWYQSLASYCNSMAGKPGKKSKRDTIIGATMGTLGDMYIDKPLCDLGIKKSMHGRKCVLNPAGLFFDYVLWDATVNMLPKKMQDNVFGKNRPVPPPPPPSNNNGGVVEGQTSGGSGVYCEKCGNVSETTVGADPNALNDSLWGTGWQAPAGTVGGAGTTTSVQGANPWATPSPRSNPTGTKTSGIESSATTISVTNAVPPPPPPPPPAKDVSVPDESSLF